MSAKEIIKAAPTGHSRQFEVRNNFSDLLGKWEDSYVNFSGYFGKHGPHVFAAAPDLLEALEVIANIATKPHHERALPAILDIARNSIAKAKGEKP